MKTSASKLRIGSLHILLILLLNASISSCRTTQPVLQSEYRETNFAQRTDSVFLHDSIFVHEYARGDTVYIDRIRDRWKERIVATTDTVYQTSTTTSTSTVRYVPRFYKWCTGLFWGAVILFIIYIALRIAKAVYLRR